MRRRKRGNRMGKKGESKSQKSLAVGKIRKFARKENTFAAKSSPGTHKAEESVPLSFALIQLIQAATNLREVKAALNERKVMVNKVVRKDPKFPVGLFDLISLNEKKHYQMLLDFKGRLYAEEVEKDKSKSKLCRVTGKKAVKKGMIRISTNDGRVFEDKKMEYNIGDTVKISVPDQKILERKELKEGEKVYIIAGSHAGEKAAIKEVIEGKLNIPKIVALKNEENEFRTVAKNVMVIE